MESPETLVREIYEQYDLSESQIVAKLAELGVKTSQPTLNRIRHGKARGTTFELGAALLQLRDKLRRTQSPGLAEAVPGRERASV